MSILCRIRNNSYLRSIETYMRPYISDIGWKWCVGSVYRGYQEVVSSSNGITFKPYNTPCCKVFLYPYIICSSTKTMAITPLKCHILGCYPIINLTTSQCYKHQLHWCCGCGMGACFAPQNDTYMWPLLLGLNKRHNYLITNVLCGILGFVAGSQK